MSLCKATPYGHLKLNLGTGPGRSQWVHRLVLHAFAGPPGDGQVARHLDGDPTNNALGNLVWGSPSENNADMVEHGRSTRGTANARAKLTEEQVQAIRASSDSVRTLGKRYGVDFSTISQIRTGKLWGWLPDAG